MGKDFGYIQEKNKSYWNFYSIISNQAENSIAQNISTPHLMVNNAAIALQSVLVLNANTPFKINTQKAIQSIISTRLAGRCDVRKLPNGTSIIFDVAHNPQAASQLASFLDTYKKQSYSQKKLKITALFSMLEDKDISGTIDYLKDHIDEWHTAEIDSERRASKEQLQAAFEHHQIAPIWHQNLKTACDVLINRTINNHDIIVVFGSFLVVEVVLTYLGVCKAGA